nr:MAG TPA: Potassium voltage-gated channel subfamily E, Membrane protein, Ion channel [Caudoviricetes sp.]
MIMAELLFDIFLFSCTTAIGFIIGYYYSRK